MPEIKASAIAAMHNVTINVRIVRASELRARVWLGTRIIRFGIWVTGARGEINGD